MKRAVARVAERSVRQGDLEESAAGDRQVQGAVGGGDAALRIVRFGGGDAYAGAEREAGRVLRVLRALGADLPDILVHEILERARCDLNPVVFAFARLLAMIAICVFWASRPVFADQSA